MEALNYPREVYFGDHRIEGQETMVKLTVSEFFASSMGVKLDRNTYRKGEKHQTAGK